jgi:allantoin racemase
VVADLLSPSFVEYGTWAQTMRILFINPNITSSITELMAAEARRSAALGTELVPVTAEFGTLYVENRVEATIAAHAVLEACAAHSDGCDAVIISAFGDPGLYAAKELLDLPVVGVSEAAFLAAYMLGNRYAIVCLTPRLKTWYVETAHAHGLNGKLVAARAIAGPVPDITRAKDDLRAMVLAECLRAIAEDDAEVIIIGGGPIAGLAREISAEVPVSAAVKLAEAIVGLEPRPPRKGSFARPAYKPALGLSPALMRRITGSN